MAVGCAAAKGGTGLHCWGSLEADREGSRHRLEGSLVAGDRAEER